MHCDLKPSSDRRRTKAGGCPALQTLARNADVLAEQTPWFMESFNDSSITHWDHEPQQIEDENENEIKRV